MGDMQGGMPPEKPMMGNPMAIPEIKDNASIMNPVDLAAMKQSGEFNPQMSIREVLAKLGMTDIDAPGSAMQLVEFGKKQVQNADMTNKMQNIAGGAGPAPGPVPPQAPPEEIPPQGLDSLV